MNPLTKRANNVYDALNNTERKINYLIAIIGGIVLGVMLGLGV